MIALSSLARYSSTAFIRQHNSRLSSQVAYRITMLNIIFISINCTLFRADIQKCNMRDDKGKSFSKLILNVTKCELDHCNIEKNTLGILLCSLHIHDKGVTPN